LGTIKERLLPFATSDWVRLSPDVCRGMHLTIGDLSPRQTLGQFFAAKTKATAAAAARNSGSSLSASGPTSKAPPAPAQPARAPLAQASPRTSPFLAPSRHLSPLVACSPSHAPSSDSGSSCPSPLDVDPQPSLACKSRFQFPFRGGHLFAYVHPWAFKAPIPKPFRSRGNSAPRTAATWRASRRLGLEKLLLLPGAREKMRASSERRATLPLLLPLPQRRVELR
jgi:hypothetical protein